MFYDKYQELCRKNGISCKKAAIDMGIAHSAPSKWKERGSTPNGETLSKIADYFGITVDELLGKEQKKIEVTEGLFFDRFKQYCDARGITPTRAGTEIGLSRTSAATWKARGTTPNGKTLAKIAAYFGITVDELLGAESEKSPAAPVDPATAELMEIINKMSDEQRTRALDVLKAAFGER